MHISMLCTGGQDEVFAPQWRPQQACLSLSVHLRQIAMDKTEVLATVVEIARQGHGMCVPDALEHVATLIRQENPNDVEYEKNIGSLLRLGACIWFLRHKLLLP
jgi:hypothetical protein